MLICVTAIAVAFGLSMAIGSLLATLLFAIVYCVLPTPLVIFATLCSRRHPGLRHWGLNSLVDTANLDARRFVIFKRHLATDDVHRLRSRGGGNAAMDSVHWFLSGRVLHFWPWGYDGYPALTAPFETYLI